MSAYARATDPDTSHESAHHIEKKSKSLLSQVYTAIQSLGEEGGIQDEIVDLFPHLRRHTVVPRFAKLLDMGIVEVVGKRRSPETGRLQEVLRSVPGDRCASSVAAAKASKKERDRNKVREHVKRLMRKPLYREEISLFLMSEELENH